MLTPEQERSLKLRNETAGDTVVNGLPSPTCTWIGESGIDFNVQFIAIEAQVSASAPGSSVARVDRFGAIQNVESSLSSGMPFCQLTIDVAQGQSIRVQALAGPGGPAPGIDEQCRRANEVASMVMTTVVALTRP